jgi:hypothetical protein
MKLIHFNTKLLPIHFRPQQIKVMMLDRSSALNKGLINNFILALCKFRQHLYCENHEFGR